MKGYNLIKCIIFKYTVKLLCYKLLEYSIKKSFFLSSFCNLDSVFRKQIIRKKLRTLLNVCREAARNGHFEIIKYIVENEDPAMVDASTCNYAVVGGNLDILIYLREHVFGCEWNSGICTNAVKHNRLEILKWAVEKGCIRDSLNCLELAEKRGFVKIVEFIREFYQVNKII